MESGISFLIFTIVVATVTVVLKRRQYRKNLEEIDSLISELDKQKLDFIRSCEEKGIEVPEFYLTNN